MSKFLYVLKGKLKALLVMMLFFIFVSCLETLGIGLIGPFISLAINPNLISQNYWLNSIYTKFNFSSKEQFLTLLGLLVIAIFYLKSFLNFNVQKSIFEFGFNQQGELSYRLMKLYMAAPYTFHLGRNSAVLIQNTMNETERFANSLMMPLLTSISNAIVIFTLVLLLVNTNALAIVIIAGILGISFFIFHRFKDRFAHWGKEGSEARTEMIRIINHSLGGLKETRVIGCESYFTNQLHEQTKRFGTSASLAVSFANLPRYMIEAFLITFLISFTLIFIAINQGNSENLSSVLGIFALASIRLLPAAGNLISSINGIKYNSHSLDKIYFDFKELEMVKAPQISLSQKHKLVSSSQAIGLTDKIVLDNVVYCYPNTSRNSLEGISLEINKGQSIGLIGKSGAGKTTLVDVILGLLIPQSGDIRVDGISIYGNLRCWQNMIGYVPQSIFLIDDTLEKNIAFGVADHLIDQNKLNKAIQVAQLSEIVEQLPNGIKTEVGERGVLLSGGQRQRVGIARALYHEREILVFDEATAALDNETESLVTEAIKSLSGIKTTIIIAHRLSTIEHCDRIYSLDKGQVVKSGSYQEVVLGKTDALRDKVQR